MVNCLLKNYLNKNYNHQT